MTNPRREAREKAGLTIAQAAKLAFVKATTIEGYERGRSVPFHRAELLARAYECRLEVFMAQMDN